MDSKYKNFENKDLNKEQSINVDYESKIPNIYMTSGDIDFRKGDEQIYLDRCLSEKKGMGTCPVRYSLAIAILWSIFLGLTSGFLLAILESNGGQQYKAEFVLTLIHFLICFCLICQPANEALVRVWLLTGLVWISGMAISYYRTDWMERDEDWWMALLIGSISWMSTVGLPLSILFLLNKCI